MVFLCLFLGGNCLSGRDVAFPENVEIIGPTVATPMRYLRHVKLSSSNFSHPLILDYYGRNSRKIAAIGCHILGKDLLITEPILVRLLQCPTLLQLGQIGHFGAKNWQCDCPSFSRLENSLASLYLIHRNCRQEDRRRYQLALVAAVLRQCGIPALTNPGEAGIRSEAQILKRLDYLARTQDVSKVLARGKFNIQDLREMEMAVFGDGENGDENHKPFNPESVASLFLMAEIYGDICRHSSAVNIRDDFPTFALADLIASFRMDLGQRACFFSGEEPAKIAGRLSLFFVDHFFADPLTIARQSYLREIMRRFANQNQAFASELVRSNDDELLEKIRHSSDETVQLFRSECPQSRDDIEILPQGEGEMNLHCPKNQILDPIFHDQNGTHLLSHRDPEFGACCERYRELCARGFSIVLKRKTAHECDGKTAAHPLAE